jgi:hypothetical protein
MFYYFLNLNYKKNSEVSHALFEKQEQENAPVRLATEAIASLISSPVIVKGRLGSELFTNTSNTILQN